MNCIVGMNDSSEINFVENYIYSKNSKDVSLVNFKDVNSTFIFCCSPIDSQKRLSMWRLYGNDAKGVCLEFEINLKKRCRFKICDIAYITFDNTNDASSKGMVSVKVFDLLKSFIDWVSFGGKYKFRFNTLHDWAHFFKPEEYADEKEIRVLYKDRRKNNSKWTLRPDSRIFSPYIEFELNDVNFPLKLKSVVLGPKCSEVKVNLNQIRDFMKSSGFIDVDVKESPIVTYR